MGWSLRAVSLGCGAFPPAPKNVHVCGDRVSEEGMAFSAVLRVGLIGPVSL